MHKMLKRSIVAFAAACVMSTSAMAQSTAVSKAVQLSDAELDNVTAGSVFLLVGIANPGRAEIFRVSETKFLCVNCDDVGRVTPTGGFILVWKPGTSPADTPFPFVMQEIGSLRLSR